MYIAQKEGHCVFSLKVLIWTNFAAVSAVIAQLHRQYDELTSKHIDSLRQLTKQIQDARIARDNDAIKTSLEVRQERFSITCLVSIASAKHCAASGQCFFLFREIDLSPGQVTGTSTKNRTNWSEYFWRRASYSKKLLFMCVICGLIRLESEIGDLSSFEQFQNMPVND